MEIIAQLQSLLPIEFPFYIDRVEKDEDQEEVHIYLGIDKTYRPGENYRIHSYYDRHWEHLQLFQYRSFLHCRLPIYENKDSGERKAMQVHFSRENSRFTLLYEAKVMHLMRLYHCFATVARQLGIHKQRVENIYHFYTTSSFNSQSIPVCDQIGLDETSTRKGHDYISLFVDMKTHQILHIEDGREADVIKRFLQVHPDPECIKELSIDMSPAFIKGIGQYLPLARMTFDKWHVLKLFSKSLKELTRAYRSLTSYAATLREQLKMFYEQTSLEKAKAQLAFISDFIEELIGKNPISKSLRKHFDGIVEHIRSNLTNGVLEGINSKIQTIKRVARGFRYKENFKKMILFVFGTLKPQLPSKII